jgi:hypothetical protein
MKQIDILYFDGCPGWRPAEDRVRQVVREAGLDDAVSVRLVPVETEQEAETHRFVGSPTIRIDGHDVDPAAAQLTNFGLQCRLYQSDGRLDGLPPADLIRAALGLKVAPSGSPVTEPTGCCGGGPCR